MRRPCFHNDCVSGHLHKIQAVKFLIAFWSYPASAMHLTVSLLNERQLFISRPIVSPKDRKKKKMAAIFWTLRPLFNVTAD